MQITGRSKKSEPSNTLSHTDHYLLVDVQFINNLVTSTPSISVENITIAATITTNKSVLGGMELYERLNRTYVIFI